MNGKSEKSHPVLSFFSLSDDYERRARFLPAVLTVLVFLPVALAFGIGMMQFVQLLFTGAGVGAVLAVGISHLASAMGNRLQHQLWPEWPHDAPTNRWLHPSDHTRSAQQKEQWYSAIKRLTNLDISQAAVHGEEQEVERVINDAVTTIRSRLWKRESPEVDLLRLRNIDYGYARNLTGFRALSVPGSFLSCTGCWIAWWWFDAHLLWCVVSTSLAVLLPFAAYLVLPQYVRHKADYYAEAFFSSMEKLAAESPEE